MDPSVTYIGPGGEHLPGSAGAVAAEIQEYDDQGVPTGRTYADIGEPRVTLSSDPDDAAVVDPEATDAMAKTTWDVRDAAGAIVDDVPALISALGAGGDLPAQRSAVAGLMELPAWQAAPAELKTKVYAWLESTRPAA